MYCPKQSKLVLLSGSSTSRDMDGLTRSVRDTQEAAEEADQFSDSDMVSPRRGRIIHARCGCNLALRRAARCGRCHSDVQSCMTVYREKHSAMQVRRLTADNTKHGVGE